MDLQVLIKYLQRAIMSGDVRAMHLRTGRLREYFRRTGQWS